MRVLIADDHALFRDGLRSLLEAHGVTDHGGAEEGVDQPLADLQVNVRDANPHVGAVSAIYDLSLIHI